MASHLDYRVRYEPQPLEKTYFQLRSSATEKIEVGMGQNESKLKIIISVLSTLLFQ